MIRQVVVGNKFTLPSFTKFTGDPAEKRKVAFFTILQKPIDESQNRKKCHLHSGSPVNFRVDKKCVAA